MTSNERILQPFTLPNGTELKNRLLMAPMTTCTAATIWPEIPPHGVRLAAFVMDWADERLFEETE